MNYEIEFFKEEIRSKRTMIDGYLKMIEELKRRVEEQKISVYSWLGFWRDKLPPEAVAALQKILGPLETEKGEFKGYECDDCAKAFPREDVERSTVVFGAVFCENCGMARAEAEYERLMECQPPSASEQATKQMEDHGPHCLNYDQMKHAINKMKALEKVAEAAREAVNALAYMELTPMRFVANALRELDKAKGEA